MTPRHDGRPIFLDLADRIADDILAGVYPEETQVPSTTELSVHYRINPATAGKALSRLVDDGVLYRRRGLGTFVATGGPDVLRRQRLAEFSADYIRPVLEEARRLGIARDQLIDLVRQEQS